MSGFVMKRSSSSTGFVNLTVYLGVTPAALLLTLGLQSPENAVLHGGAVVTAPALGVLSLK